MLNYNDKNNFNISHNTKPIHKNNLYGCGVQKCTFKINYKSIKLIISQGLM